MQINYLWQLQHKPISSRSFPPTSQPAPTPGATDNTDAENEDETSTSLTATSVLASATETNLRGPALGPELFVEAVLYAYTSFLEREIVNGPVGQRMRERQPPGPGRRASPPGKVLIAAALPPLVEDDILPRIPEKYVERLEEDHEKAQRAMRRSLGGGSRTPWAKGSPVMKAVDKPDDVEAGLSMLSVTDDPGSPQSSSSSLSRTSSIFDAQQMNSSVASVLTTPSEHPKPCKVPIITLLTHDPPLCTLAVRKSMTELYNSGMSTFCAQYPDILGFVDISSAMQPVDRATWACPVDPTNIHPLWEPTLPLWLKALAEHGVPTDGYSITVDAEETFKAYEVDKKRRTEKRDGE